MNIADIEKVANRKRINAEAEKLREKVTRQTANIIKLKVAQDTAYWDLKEKLHQLENNHERLQQNMVEVQMQHETISGQYQDELRLRPETLNKLSSTREICDVLEEYSGRLKATLSRCQADLATLAEAYNKSGQLVRDIKGQQIQAEEKSQQLIQNLLEKLKLVHEHKEQMAQLFASAKQHHEAELNDTRAKLATALGQKDELFVALNDFSRKLDHFKRELEKKDDNIASLQVDMKESVNQYNNEAAEMKNLLAKKDKDIKEFLNANEALKKALQNQDQYSKLTCEQNNQLQEKIYSLEEEQLILSNKINEAEKRFEEANALYYQLMKEKEQLYEKNLDLQKEVTEKTSLLEQAAVELQNLKTNMSALETEKSQVAADLRELLEQAAVEHQNLKTNMSTLETEKSQVAADLREVTQASDLKSDKIKELLTVIQNLEDRHAKMESDLKTEHSNQINELHVALDSKDKIIEVKNKELDCKAATINKMMSDLKNVTDAKTKVENTLDNLKKNMEIEKENLNEKMKALTSKIEQQEVTVKNKENELSNQMAIILDIRNEKIKLQERMKEMQNTIDNIQKEVTGRNTYKAREAPEQDDYAVMMTPVLLQQQVGTHAPKNQLLSKMPPRQVQKKQQDLMYLFSDSSMDNDLAIDSEEINRRFEAVVRGEAMSPLTLKRRNGTPITLGGLKPLSDKSDFAKSQAQATESNKGKRTFFKSKRSDNKYYIESWWGYLSRAKDGSKQDAVVRARRREQGPQHPQDIFALGSKSTVVVSRDQEKRNIHKPSSSGVERKREGSTSFGAAPPSKRSRIGSPAEAVGGTSLEVDPVDLVPNVLHALDTHNSDKLLGLLTGSMRLLKSQRSKPDPILCMSMLYLCKIRPNMFSHDVVTQSLCTLLKREQGAAFKSKGNLLVFVLACNMLYAGHRDSNNWPDTFIKVYIEDALNERWWVECSWCKCLVENIVTAFSTKQPPPHLIPSDNTLGGTMSPSGSGSPLMGSTDDDPDNTDLEYTVYPREQVWGQVCPNTSAGPSAALPLSPFRVLPKPAHAACLGESDCGAFDGCRELNPFWVLYPK